ncbi:hypothetical protein ABEB36_002615 [Hypothenemus hampei]|uniref:Homeobox domain-containing protein n=1 Tax=Hypothenemus hampei TaxID=57062 RepID=A0ABD1F6E4_HYPHA
MIAYFEGEMENKEQTSKNSDFSIDHILNRAGSSTGDTNVFSESNVKFHWLQCSRYCPPRVPRLPKRDVQKRQLGRHPRIPFTSYQLSILEEKFKETPYLSSEEVISLSTKLQLADIRVKIWFQNRRARERRERNLGLDRSNSEDVKEDMIHNRLIVSRSDQTKNFPSQSEETTIEDKESEIHSVAVNVPTTSPLWPIRRNVSEILKNNYIPALYSTTDSFLISCVNVIDNKRKES